MTNEKKDQPVDINIDSLTLPGILVLPKKTKSLVIFAHGSGSSRLSPRNTFVAQVLQESGIGTLLFDLLTAEEDLIYENRFNIDLITDRLVKTTRWLSDKPETKGLAFGYFGASTGVAAALKATAYLGSQVKAVVSRGGRPDLAKDILPKVKAPVLLIVGEADKVVINLNKEAYDKLTTTKKLEIVGGASHLFKEPGALEKVAEIATEWFKKHLNP